MQKYLIILFLAVIAFNPMSVLAQNAERVEYTTIPDPKIKSLVTRALKPKIDSFYKEFQYVPMLHYSRFDLNGDGKDEILARFTEEFAYRDANNNVDTHIFAYTTKGLIEIAQFQAFDIAIGDKGKSGLKEIIAFKNYQKSKYDIYEWDGKRRYVKR
jgi:hypothetical protein